MITSSYRKEERETDLEKEREAHMSCLSAVHVRAKKNGS